MFLKYILITHLLPFSSIKQDLLNINIMKYILNNNLFNIVDTFYEL